MSCIQSKPHPGKKVRTESGDWSAVDIHDALCLYTVQQAFIPTFLEGLRPSKAMKFSPGNSSRCMVRLLGTKILGAGNLHFIGDSLMRAFEACGGTAVNAPI